MIISWSVFALIYRFQSPQKWTPRIEKRACKSHQNKMICQPHPVSCDGNKRPFRNSQPIQPVHFCGGSNAPWTSSSWKSGLESGYIWILYIWMSCSNSTLKFVGRWETSLSYPTTSQSFHWAVLRPFGPQTLSRNCVSFLDTGGAPIWNLSVFRSHRCRSRCLQWNVHMFDWEKLRCDGNLLEFMGLQWLQPHFETEWKKYSEKIHHAENLRFLFPSLMVSKLSNHWYPKLPMALPMVGLNHQSDQWIEGGSPANIIGS